MAAFEFAPQAPLFLASNGPTSLLARLGGTSVALLDTGEAVFVPAGSAGDIGTLAPGTSSAHQITLVSSTEPFSFTPGAGNREVNLVRGILDPGERLHVVSPFPTLVIVVEGEVSDAPEGTLVPAGTSRAFNDADLTNNGPAPAIVLVAALGGLVP